MAEAVGDGSGDVANQPEHHLQGSTGHSRIGIISVMCSGRVLKKNEIHSATDLKDLLLFYLALNAAEYYDLSVNVFEHIWATLTDIKM
jgi:uncharacterized protein (TIGR01568 family)